MTAGVFRPYTLADVLGTINEQATQPTGTVITTQSFFSETDDGMTSSDASTTATLTTNPTWGAGTWGFVEWS